MHIFLVQYALFKLFDFLSLPFFFFHFTVACVDQMRLLIIYVGLFSGFDTFCYLQPSRLCSFLIFHPNGSSARYPNKWTLHLPSKYHGKNRSVTDLITPFPYGHISRLCGRMERGDEKKNHVRDGS